MTRPESVFIIAEAGVNHNGSLDLAVGLVDAAVAAGANAVKFQTFRADALATRSAPKARYQHGTTEAGETQHAMLRRLELTPAMHRTLIDYCGRKGIEFMSTPFDVGSANLLVELGIHRVKVGSGDLDNAPLLIRLARSQLPLIISTGMATLNDVETALGVLAFGMLGGENPGRQAFARAWESAEGKKMVRSRVTLLHCTTEYPAPLHDVNLRAIATLRDAFRLEIGYSDHTKGIAVSVAAAALGATVIEKHLTLDRSLPGPDQAASLEPGEFYELVKSVAEVALALGSPVKQVTPSEAPNVVIARKSLVALRPIAPGEVFTPDNLGAKRPGSGISPMDYWEWLGRPSPQAFLEDELVRP